MMTQAQPPAALAPADVALHFLTVEVDYLAGLCAVDRSRQYRALDGESRSVVARLDIGY